MLLNDIGKSPDTTFRRINQHLETNYGFKIAEDASDKDLVSIMEQIEEEITDLKVKGDDARGSPEISKRLLVLEGIKSLREFALMNFQSPKLNSVVGNLVDYVVDTFEITGMQQGDFERAVERAMDEYRSSRYRFPDDVIEQRVRQDAMARIQSSAALDNPQVPVIAPEMPMMEEEEDMKELDLEEGVWDDAGSAKRASALGGHAGSVPNTPQAKHAMKVLDNPALSLKPDAEEQVPMIRDKNGRMVPDPFAAHAAARRKGIVMKEHANLVKNLRRLLETEVSQAEVMMAAKGFAQELQEMVEKIGRLQNEDLPPVTDQMRETYGMESASAFQTQIYGALQSVMDSLYTAKGQVDDAVANMANTGQVTAQVDMDKDINVNVDGMDDLGAMDADASIDADLDNLEGELDAEDEFGGAEEDEPLGRAMKTESLQRKVVEMKKLVEKARKLKESRKRVNEEFDDDTGNDAEGPDDLLAAAEEALPYALGRSRHSSIDNLLDVMNGSYNENMSRNFIKARQYIEDYLDVVSAAINQGKGMTVASINKGKLMNAIQLLKQEVQLQNQ
jgi:hypothetical protein